MCKVFCLEQGHNTKMHRSSTCTSLIHTHSQVCFPNLFSFAVLRLECRASCLRGMFHPWVSVLALPNIDYNWGYQQKLAMGWVLSELRTQSVGERSPVCPHWTHGDESVWIEGSGKERRSLLLTLSWLWANKMSSRAGWELELSAERWAEVEMQEPLVFGKWLKHSWMKW
jgi:hypothetical protein